MCFAFPAHLALPDLIIDDEYKLLNSSLCTFLQPRVDFRSLRIKYYPQYQILKHILLMKTIYINVLTTL